MSALTAGIAGCSLFGKKPASNQAAPPPSQPGLSAVNSRGDVSPPAGWNGVLAGQVLDSYNHAPIAATYIQVSEAGDGGKSAAPIEVATDNHGYFMIQRLQAGHHYQLTARMKQGERLSAGTVFATPPNPKVLIQISEDFASKNTPAPPGPATFPTSPKNSIPGAEAPPPPVWPDQAGPSGIASPEPPPPTPPDQAWSPGNAPRIDTYQN